MSERQDEYIIEFYQLGGSIKVTAFDPLTMTEAVIIGASGATKQQLAELAIRKLNYVISRKANKNQDDFQ